MNFSYHEIRNQIHDGDLIAVKGTGIFSEITEFVTSSKYSHTGIAVWLGGGLWVSQMTSGGNNLVPLSQFKSFDVYKCPVVNQRVRKYVLETLRSKVEYAFADLVIAGLDFLTSFKLPPTHTGLICSAASTEAYMACGWGVAYTKATGNMLDAPPVPTPAWIASKLELKYMVG